MLKHLLSYLGDMNESEKKQPAAGAWAPVLPVLKHRRLTGSFTLS